MSNGPSFRANQVWRQTTWTGFFVRQLQAIGDHFSPFFATLMQTDADRSLPQFLFLTMLRVLVIAGWIAAAYAVAQVISMLIGGGREIIIEDEIIIEHDDDDDDGGNDSKNNKSNSKLRRRSARSKKEAEN